MMMMNIMLVLLTTKLTLYEAPTFVLFSSKYEILLAVLFSGVGVVVVVVVVQVVVVVVVVAVVHIVVDVVVMVVVAVVFVFPFVLQKSALLNVQRADLHYVHLVVCLSYIQKYTNTALLKCHEYQTYAKFLNSS